VLFYTGAVSIPSYKFSIPLNVDSPSRPFYNPFGGAFIFTDFITSYISNGYSLQSASIKVGFFIGPQEPGHSDIVGSFGSSLRPDNLPDLKLPADFISFASNLGIGFDFSLPGTPGIVDLGRAASTPILYPKFVNKIGNAPIFRIHTPVPVSGVRGDNWFVDPEFNVASNDTFPAILADQAGLFNIDYLVIDPDYATGYDFRVDGCKEHIASFILPVQTTSYVLHVSGSPDEVVEGGRSYVFKSHNVCDFVITNIDETAPLSLSDPSFFYGLTFYGSFENFSSPDIIMTALLNNALPLADPISTPEPSAIAVFGAALLSLSLVNRRKAL